MSRRLARMLTQQMEEQRATVFAEMDARAYGAALAAALATPPKLELLGPPMLESTTFVQLARELLGDED